MFGIPKRLCRGTDSSITGRWAQEYALNPTRSLNVRIFHNHVALGSLGSSAPVWSTRSRQISAGLLRRKGRGPAAYLGRNMGFVKRSFRGRSGKWSFMEGLCNAHKGAWGCQADMKALCHVNSPRVMTLDFEVCGCS